jgi:hypothetical protein
MKMTTAAGQTVFVVARVWDGTRWVMMPERIMFNEQWWIINLLMATAITSLGHPVNLDGNFHVTADVTGSLLFEGSPTIW